MNLKKTYYPYFDYLRIALATIVMLGHDGLIRWGQSGNLAVQVFFALSGWLIGGILLRLSTDDLPRFYFNRALRIWIPYYIACLCSYWSGGGSKLHAVRSWTGQVIWIKQRRNTISRSVFNHSDDNDQKQDSDLSTTDLLSEFHQARNQ